MPDAAPAPVELNHETFAPFVRTHRHVVVHFWAAWNAHDVLMERMISSGLPAELRASVAIARFDVAPPDHQEICLSLEVLNVPFLAFYRDGILVRTVTGLREPQVIIGYFRALLTEGD